VTDTGLARLDARLDALVPTLQATLDAPLPALPAAARTACPWITTGIGASEGPARVLAALVRRRLGDRAEFAPVSALADEGLAPGATHVVFSQGLSPNARMTLRAAGPEHPVWLVTAATARDGLPLGPACWVAEHPPADESGLLLRVLGPAAATLTAVRLVVALASLRGQPAPTEALALGEVPAAVRSARDRAHAVAASLAAEQLARIALVTLDAGLDLAHGLRWKWLEGPSTCDPPVWDLLQFAHGPFQHLVGRPTTLFVLLRGAPREADLLRRLREVTEADGHTLVTLEATLPGALSFFEHDAMLNVLCRAALAAFPRDLVHWPGQGRDTPLYAL